MIGDKKPDEPKPDTPNWLERIPEQYRSNPAQFFDEHEQLQQKYGVAKQHQDWYEGQYQPWAKEHIALPKSDYTQYQEWSASRNAKPAPQTPQQEPQASDIDWSDPEAPEKAYKTMMASHLELKNSLTGLGQAFESGRDNVLELVRLTEQARQLEREEDLGFFQKKFEYTPRTNIRDVAKYAGEHQISDLRQAWKELYETANLEDIKKQTREEAYAKAKADALNEFTNRHTTTEASTGLPSRIRAPRDQSVPRGYGAKGREEMIADLLRKHAS